MILQMKRGDAWRYWDNLKDVTIVTTSDGLIDTGEIHFFSMVPGDNEPKKLLLQEKAYLLNDNGKTIRVIDPVPLEN